MKVRRQPGGRVAGDREERADGVSPATVNDADQLSFFAVVPDGQSHLAQGPRRSLRGTVERRRQVWEKVGPREAVARPSSSRLHTIFLSSPLTCQHAAGAAAAPGLRRCCEGVPPRAPVLHSERRSCGCGCALPLLSAGTPGSRWAREL